MGRRPAARRQDDGEAADGPRHDGRVPNGLDTVIRVGDVEGNLGVNGTIMVTAHRPGDVVLSIDPHGGDEGYDPDESADEQPS